jgi:GNAT superfamily N-acetyltransferase
LEIIEINSTETIAIRHEVLWPNEAPEFCIVEGDSEASHFAVLIDTQIVCVASIYIDGDSARLRKFATLNKFQGKGIGSFMLNHLIKKLKQQGMRSLWFDARESAVAFYNRLGFTMIGKRFYKNGIAYYKMHTDL